MIKIQYRHVEEFPGWGLAHGFLSDLVAAHGARCVMEVGSGANPTLMAADLDRHRIRYTTNDISEAELAKAPAGFERLHCDLCDPGVAQQTGPRYDMIFSRMVNEHVADGHRYYLNLFEMLKPGGLTAHCFSTLYAWPFLANRLIPEGLGMRLLDLFSKRDEHLHGKFKAHYSWSRGPSRGQIQRFESIGFEVLEYYGYFGHHYYRRLPWLNGMEQAKARWLVRHPSPMLTSYAHIILRKPINSSVVNTV